MRCMKALKTTYLTLFELGATTVTVPVIRLAASSLLQCRWNTPLGTTERERVSIHVRSASTSTLTWERGEGTTKGGRYSDPESCSKHPRKTVRAFFYIARRVQVFLLSSTRVDILLRAYTRYWALSVNNSEYLHTENPFGGIRTQAIDFGLWQWQPFASKLSLNWKGTRVTLQHRSLWERVLTKKSKLWNKKQKTYSLGRCWADIALRKTPKNGELEAARFRFLDRYQSAKQTTASWTLNRAR